MPNNTLRCVCTMYFKNGEVIKTIPYPNQYGTSISKYREYYREINTDKLIFIDRWVHKNRNHKRISKMMEQAWKYYYYKTNRINKIYNSKDEIMNDK